MQRIFSRNMLICIFTGFTSGLPLYFLINLIPAWLRTENIDLKTIGLMSLIGLPFTWKFIWSPVMDAVRPPFLGRRRGWMLVTQIGLLLTLAAYAFLNPHQHLPIIVGLSVAVAFFFRQSGYRTGRLPPRNPIGQRTGSRQLHPCQCLPRRRPRPRLVEPNFGRHYAVEQRLPHYLPIHAARSIDDAASCPRTRHAAHCTANADSNRS